VRVRGANSPTAALTSRERADLDLTLPTYRGSPCDPLHLKTQDENDNARILHTMGISTEHGGAEPQEARRGDSHPGCGGIGVLAGCGSGICIAGPREMTSTASRFGAARRPTDHGGDAEQPSPRDNDA
jgi:hypothetical protein